MESIEYKILDICRNNYHYLMTLKNVKGVGFGLKEINGIKTLEPCVHVLVEKKLDRLCLTSNNVIPKFYMGIKTDVINVGNVRAFSASPITKKFRPLQGGCSIAVQNGTEDGTMGCIVERGFVKKEYFILSNNHVLSEFGKNPIGSAIVQPSDTYGGTLKDTVAYLSEAIPIKFIKGIKSPINLVDCAIGKVTNKSLISKIIYQIGNVKGTNKAILNENVKKTGFITGLTKGVVKTIGLTQHVEFSPTKTAIFKEQILFDLKGGPGDSGSVILNKYNQVIALLIGGSETENIALGNDINIVLKQLNVSIYK